MSPMFLTRTANPVNVSAVPGTGTGPAEAKACKDHPRPSGFSTGARFAGSKAMEFGGTERETRSAPSY